MFETIKAITQDHVFDQTRRELAQKEMKEAQEAIKFLLSIRSKDTSGECVICHGYFHHGTLHKHKNDCPIYKIEEMLK